MNDDTKSKTPITDAFREALKNPEFRESFVKTGNALAGVLRTAHEASQTYASFEDLDKVHLRVGAVRAAERVEGSKGGKLLKLSVDFGESTLRTVISGIGLTFTPETLFGNKYAFITNLEPRKMMGIESQAMILASGTPENLSLCQLTGNATPGAELG